METQDFALLDLAGKGSNIVLRDDQSEFAVILDSVKACRKNGGRLSLIVTGKFPVYELEWLGEAGADLYAAEESGASGRELALLTSACRRGGAVVAYHSRGILAPSQEPGLLSFSDLKELARSGIYIHLSNKDEKRDFSELAELAYQARKGGSWLVYYHHGALGVEVKDLARNGAWIHLSDASLSEAADLNLISDAAGLSARAGANLVVHVEKGLTLDWLEEISGSGAALLFKIVSDDNRRAMRALERKAKKNKLDFRSYYLYPNFML